MLDGRALAERGEAERAREAFVKALQAFDDGGSAVRRGVVTYARGVALLGVGRQAEAETVLHLAFEQGEDTPDLRRHLATAIAEQGRQHEAYEYLQQAVPRAVHDWRAWILMARLADDLGESDETRAEHWRGAWLALADADRHDAALDAIRRVHDLDPSPQTHYWLAVAQARAGHAMAALDTLRELNEIEPQSATSMLAAEILTSLGRHDEAIEASSAALDLSPEDTDLLERHAYVLQSAERFEELLGLSERMAVVGLPAAAAYRGLGLLRIGRAPEAALALTEAAEVDPNSPVLRGLLGEALAESGSHEAALHQFEAAAALDPSPWRRARRANALAVLGSGDRARDDLLTLIAEHPEYSVAHALLGKLLLDSGNAEEARHHLRRAVEMDAGAAWVWVNLARAEVATDDTARAKHAYEKALELEPASVATRADLAGLLLIEKDPASWTRAQELLEAALEVDRSAPLLHELLGESLRLQGRLKEAVTHFDSALDLDASDSYALASRGQALLAIGERTEEAISNIEAATKISPQSVWMHDLLVNAYLGADDYKRADIALKALAKLDATSARPWLMRAEIRKQEGHPEKAERMLRKALQLDPELRDVRNELAEYLIDTDRAEESRTFSEESLRRDENDEMARYLHASALMNLKQFQLAGSEAERLASSPEWGVRAWRLLGEIHRVQGHYEEALNWLDKSLEQEPNSAWALGSRGAVLSSQGDAEEGEKALRQALAIEPRNSFAASHLTDLLLASGRAEEAVEVYRAALNEDEQDADLLISYAGALRGAGRTDEALAALDQALWIRPDDLRGLSAMGSVLTLVNRVEEALDCFRRAVDLAEALPSGGGVESFVDLAYALLNSGDIGGAWDISLRAVKRNEDNPAGWIVVSAVATRVGGWEEAIFAAGRSTKCEWQQPNAYQSLGWALEHSDRPDRATAALEAYDEALRLDDGDLWARKGRANSLVLLDRREEALAEYESVLGTLRRQVSTDWTSSALEGWCLFRLGRYSEAASALHHVLLYAEQTSGTLFDLALAALGAKQTSQARSYAVRAIEDLVREVPPMRRGTLLIALDDFLVSRPSLPDVTQGAASWLHGRLQEELRLVESEWNHEQLAFPDEPPWATEVDVRQGAGAKS